jgi:hypothetical protein
MVGMPRKRFRYDLLFENIFITEIFSLAAGVWSGILKTNIRITTTEIKRASMRNGVWILGEFFP